MDAEQLPLEHQPDPRVELPTPQTEQVAAPDEQAVLRQQLIESQQREAEANRQRDQERTRLDTLLSQPRTPQIPSAEDIRGIPDPIEDADAFRTYMATQQRRQQEELDRRLEETRRASEDSNNANMLWTLFQQRYPSYANLFDLARTAFQDVSASGSVGDTDALLSAVKARMDALRGGPIEATAPTPANRTAGTSGGTTTTTTPKPASEDDVPPKSLSDEILDWQEEAGYLGAS